VCPEILNANQEVEPLQKLPKQTDALRAKNRLVAATEPGNLIPRPLAYPPHRNPRLQEEAMEMMRERMVWAGAMSGEILSKCENKRSRKRVNHIRRDT
jgi:hypothetical protein